MYIYGAWAETNKRALKYGWSQWKRAIADPNFAQELAAIEMPPGDTAGALVQNLSVAVYNGQVTQSEAIQMAIESGEDVSTLVYYFNAIKGLYED